MSRSRSIISEHWAEASLALILLVLTAIAKITGKIGEDAAAVIDVVTAAATIYVVILKADFAKKAAQIVHRQRLIESKTGIISSILEELSGSDFSHAVGFVDTALEHLRLIPQGTIKLDPSAYYNELTAELRSMKRNDHISAVSCRPIARWESDPRQLNYFEENVRAAKRGVKITRVFVVDRSQLAGEYRELVREVLIQQREAGINCRLVWKESIKQDSLYEDFVLFDEHNVVFIDENEKVDPTRVLAGYRISNAQKLQKFRGIFLSLTETYCVGGKSLEELLS